MLQGGGDEEILDFDTNSQTPFPSSVSIFIHNMILQGPQKKYLLALPAAAAFSFLYLMMLVAFFTLLTCLSFSLSHLLGIGISCV